MSRQTHPQPLVSPSLPDVPRTRAQFTAARTHQATEDARFAAMERLTSGTPVTVRRANGTFSGTVHHVETLELPTGKSTLVYVRLESGAVCAFLPKAVQPLTFDSIPEGGSIPRVARSEVKPRWLTDRIANEAAIERAGRAA